ncbi:MAG: extracellular solute-binding protein [Anaerolineaceae bacterium]|nr:extracellular solute-binding protein [Anaerolineaceae bacterium]
MNKKVFVVLSLVISLSILLSACTQPAAAPTAAPAPTEAKPEATVAVVKPSEAPAAEPAKKTEPVTVTFWHAYNADVEAKFLDEILIPEFEKQNPDIKIESVLVPYDQFRRKLLIALNGGSAPDLARLDIIWVPELADQGALVNLDEGMKDFAAYSQQFLEGPLSTNLYNGKHYGLPLDTNTRVLVWNKDMFKAAGIEAAPKTMEEFSADCEKIKALGPDRYCFADGGTYAWAVNPWIWSFGGDVTDKEVSKASGVYNGPETVAAYQFLKDGLDKGYIHPGITGGGVDAWGGFGKDQIAMVLEGPWFPPMFGGQFKDKQYGMALMPAGKGGSISVVGGEDIAMFQQSQNKEAAEKFMKYLLSEEVQMKLVSVGQMPVLKSAAENEAIKNHPFFGIFLEQLKTAKARTPHPAWNKIEEIMTNTGAEILAGKVEVQKGLDEAVAKIDPLMVIK